MSGHNKAAFLFISFILGLFCAVGYLLTGTNGSPEPGAHALTSPPILNRTAIGDAYGKLPIHFEPNVGQTDETVDFVARGNNYALFLSGGNAVLSLQRPGRKKAATLKMSLADTTAGPAIGSGQNEAASRSNYFIGADPTKWRTDVLNYERVRYHGVYDGIDLVYYGSGQRLEYDFAVAPGADPDRIALSFEGAKKAEIEKSSGDLLLNVDGEEPLRQHKPVVYQEINGERREVASSYGLKKKNDGRVEVRFILGDYDRAKALVIDPVLTYGTYLGGNAFDEGDSITADAAGNAYVVGTSASLNFPVTAGAFKTTNPPVTSGVQWYDAFVVKLNPNGTAAIFSTYFGGRNGSESGGGIAVDAQGNVIFAGTTMANDLPLVNPYQAQFGGTDDAFAAKLNAAGNALVYSTYLGGNNTDLGGKIALNATTGDTVFTGTAYSPNFPTTPGAYKERQCAGGTSCNGIFFTGSYLVKLNSAGGVLYSTLFDAGISDVVLDSADNATLGGTRSAGFPTTPGAFQPASSGGVEGFIAKMNPAGSAVVFATYLGGGLESDRILGITLDSADNIYVTGRTENNGFPTTAGVLDRTFNGVEDGFVTKLNAVGSALVFSTFLGGPGNDQPYAIGLGTDNSPFISGQTTSGVNFPLRNSLNGTSGNIFLTRLDPNASALVYSTYLGTGSAFDIAVDASNNAYVTGHTTNILVTPNAFQTVRNQNPNNISDKDGYAVKVGPANETGQTFSISGMVTDQNPQVPGFVWPIVATISGTVNRSVNVNYSGGPYSFSNLPAGGNYTIAVSKAGFDVTPESAIFNNLGANQFADFTVLLNHKPMGTVTSPSHGATFNAPASINITATAADEDGDAITRVDFEAYNSAVGSIHLGTDTTAPYEFTWNDVGVGTWAIYAIPTDAKGLRGDSQPTVHVNVINGGSPTVSITSPMAGQNFVEGDYVPLAVSVSPSVTRVEIRDQNNALIGGMNGSPWTSTWRVMNTGMYTLTARAWNAQNQSVFSAPVNITVGSIDHHISGRILDNITNSPVQGVTLNLTSPANPSITATTTSGADGTYMFTNLGTTPNDGAVITPSHPSYTFNPASINIAYLGYIDWTNQNFTAEAVTQISVSLTSPTQGQVFNAPATIDLAADASSGAGTITKVEFFRRQGVNEILLATDTQAPYQHQVTGEPQGFPYYFARATDSTGAVKESESVRVQINAPVTNVRLQGDITDPGGGWMSGVTVVLTGTANGQPVNQTSVSNFFGSYGFFNIPAGGNYTITPQGSGGLTFTPPSYTFTNVTADNLDVDFVSSNSNHSPTAQITSPADGSVFTMPVAIQMNANAQDADGTIQRLTVSAVSPTRSYQVGQVLGGNFSAPWEPTEPGQYTVWASALDNGGLTTSVSINITINPPAPVSISGRVVDRNSVGIEGATVTVRNYPQEDTVITTVLTDATGNYTVADLPTFNHYSLTVSKQDYTFTPPRRTYVNLSAAQTNGDYTGTLQLPPSDFDGDGESDLAVWRPSTGVWHISQSNNNGYSAAAFGGGAFGDVIAPGNFDGDKKIDYAVFRNGWWYILQSGNGQLRAVRFGMTGDKPIAGDYDGDGRTDIAVWRPSDGVWYILRSLDGQYDFRHFGQNGDVPIAGDYDGDGITDITVLRPSDGNWYGLKSSNGEFYGTHFGMNGDMPVAGDFDGDNKSDLAVFRPSDGNWYLLRSSDGVFTAAHWGNADDTPVPGDYDKDGKTDFAVFRNTEGNWYILLSSNNSFRALHFGANGDVPVPGAYIR